MCTKRYPAARPSRGEVGERASKHAYEFKQTAIPTSDGEGEGSAEMVDGLRPYGNTDTDEMLRRVMIVSARPTPIAATPSTFVKG
jgi:hypothetical protein